VVGRTEYDWGSYLQLSGGLADWRTPRRALKTRGRQLAAGTKRPGLADNPGRGISKVARGTCLACREEI